MASFAEAGAVEVELIAVWGGTERQPTTAIAIAPVINQSRWVLLMTESYLRRLCGWHRFGSMTRRTAAAPPTPLIAAPASAATAPAARL